MDKLQPEIRKFKRLTKEKCVYGKFFNESWKKIECTRPIGEVISKDDVDWIIRIFKEFYNYWKKYLKNP